MKCDEKTASNCDENTEMQILNLLFALTLKMFYTVVNIVRGVL